MSKYRIVPKQDFGSGAGYLINGRYVKRGFIVTRDGCNCMPGATWFETVAEAMRAIPVLEETGGSPAFWSRVRAPIISDYKPRLHNQSR